MKKSRSITLAIVGSALLASGCDGSKPSRTFFDQAGNPVPRAQWKNADGTLAELYDEEGNLVPHEEINRAYSTTTSSSTTSHHYYGHTGGWFWGGGSSYYPQSRYGSSSSSGPTHSSGTVSRGGFGGTGHAMSGGSSAS